MMMMLKNISYPELLLHLKALNECIFVFCVKAFLGSKCLVVFLWPGNYGRGSSGQQRRQLRARDAGRALLRLVTLLSEL